MAAPKGHKKYGGGKQKGQKNKATRDVQAFVDAVFKRVNPLKVDQELLQSTDEKVRAMMLRSLLEFRYGKPAQPVTGEGGQGPVLHKIEMVNHIERPVRPRAAR